MLLQVAVKAIIYSNINAEDLKSLLFMSITEHRGYEPWLIDILGSNVWYQLQIKKPKGHILLAIPASFELTV